MKMIAQLKPHEIVEYGYKCKYNHKGCILQYGCKCDYNAYGMCPLQHEEEDKENDN